MAHFVAVIPFRRARGPALAVSREALPKRSSSWPTEKLLAKTLHRRVRCADVSGVRR